MDRDENGYIVVETVGTFIPFVLLVVSILSLVNIVTLQARVHYALTQAAITLSIYSYTLEVLGVANDLTTLNNKAYKVAGEINNIRENMFSAIKGISSLSDSISEENRDNDAPNRIFSPDEQAAGDPESALNLLMSYGADEFRNKVFGELVRPLVGRYLANGEMSGDEYLKSVRVLDRESGARGLDALEFYDFKNAGLGNSVLIDKDGNVKLTVVYDVEYTFGALPLPFGPTLRITQTAVTKAWLNGSGKGYW
jgi:hypothetical protein